MRTPAYTELELAKAIEDLIEIVRPHMPDDAWDALEKKHPCIEEINTFCAEGPCGMGLGYFGGHAIGDS